MALGREKIEEVMKAWSKWWTRSLIVAAKRNGLREARRILLFGLGKAIAFPVVLWLSLVVLAAIGAPEETIEGGVRVAAVVTLVAPLICLRMLCGWAWLEIDNHKRIRTKNE